MPCFFPLPVPGDDDEAGLALVVTTRDEEDGNDVSPGAMAGSPTDVELLPSLVVVAGIGALPLWFGNVPADEDADVCWPMPFVVVVVVLWSPHSTKLLLFGTSGPQPSCRRRRGL